MERAVNQRVQMSGALRSLSLSLSSIMTFSLIFSSTAPLFAADARPARTAAEIASATRPPATRMDPVRDSYGSVTVTDPYRWLEDQTAPATRDWIAAQNHYADGILTSFPGRNALRSRLGQLLKVETVDTPTEANGRYFFFRRLANQDLAVLYVRRGARGKDEVLVDPHPLSADHRTSITFLDVVTDGSCIAYGVQQGGEDEVTVHFRDVDSGQNLPDVLPRARYSGISMTPDRKTVYFARQEKEGPRVWSHAFGTDPSADRKIFGDGYGPEKFIGASLSDDGRWLLLTVSHGSAAVQTEVYVQDLGGKNGSSAPGPIVPVVNDVAARFSPRLAGDRLYLETNWNAPNGRILSVDLKDPARERWKEVVPAREIPIAGFSPAGGRLFVRYLENALAKVQILDAEGKPQGEIESTGIGTLSGVRGRWESSEVFYSFVSFMTPTTIYRYDAATKTRTIWAKESVPVESARFEVKQVRYASKDGTSVPMFLVYKKGLKRDGSHPALLTGYGGFNLPQTPAFSARVAVWVENGGVFALPNLRGGNEFGEDWHHAGMLAKKQNVFDDFVAAAEYLVRERYTSARHLAITGGSNGGLLVGAALTQRPDLFAAVVCSYPLLDMLRYQKFFVAGYWVPEYGSAENPDQFPFLYAYSPYQHVKAGTKYPAVLFVTGDSDTRVAPLHARKMTALLQASTGSDKPVMLHYDTRAGHSRGATPIPKQIDEVTDELGFLFFETGSPAPARNAGAPTTVPPIRKAS